MMKPTPSSIKFGAKLRKLRKLNYMTQSDLCLELGYESTGTISLIETGQMKMDRDRMNKAAKILNVHPIVLLSDEEMDEEYLQFLIEADKLFKNKEKSQHYSTIRSLMKMAVTEAEADKTA